MAAGISDRLWDMSDIVNLIDAAEAEPKKRGPIKSALQFQTDALPLYRRNGTRDVL
jgi:hypothetical protein